MQLATMNSRTTLRVVLVALLLTAFAGSAEAQRFRFPFTVTDGTNSQRLVLGVDTSRGPRELVWIYE